MACEFEYVRAESNLLVGNATEPPPSRQPSLAVLVSRRRRVTLFRAGPAQILAICDDIRARPALARSLSTVGPPTFTRFIRFRRSSEAKAPGSRSAAASMAGRPPAAPLVGAAMASGTRRTTPRLCQNPRVSTPVCLQPAAQ